MELLIVFIFSDTLVFFWIFDFLLHVAFLVTVPLSWTYTTLYCPVRGLFTLGSIPIVVQSSRALFRYSCGIMLRFTLLFIWLISVVFSVDFVSSIPHTLLVRTYLLLEHKLSLAQPQESCGVYSWTRRLLSWGSLPMGSGHRVRSFQFFSSSVIHFWAFGMHTPLCHYFVDYVLSEDFIIFIHVSIYSLKYFFKVGPILTANIFGLK